MPTHSTPLTPNHQRARSSNITMPPMTLCPGKRVVSLLVAEDTAMAPWEDLLFELNTYKPPTANWFRCLLTFLGWRNTDRWLWTILSLTKISHRPVRSSHQTLTCNVDSHSGGLSPNCWHLLHFETYSRKVYWREQAATHAAVRTSRNRKDLDYLGLCP